MSSWPAIFLPLTDTGTPASKPTSTTSACSGAFSGGDGHRQARLPVGLLVRVLDLGAFVADVPEVAVLAVDLLLAGGDRDALLLGVFDGALAVAQLEARVLPRRDDLELRVERHVGQLEAHLVVALAGRAVGDGVGAGLRGRLRPGAWRSAAGRCWCPAGNPAHRSHAPAAWGSRTARRIPGAGP